MGLNRVRTSNQPRSSPGVCVVNGALFAVGGWLDVRTRLRSVERYDVNSNTWSRVCDMHHDRCGTAVASCNNLLYAIAGDNSNKTAEIYDADLDTWTILPES